MPMATASPSTVGWVMTHPTELFTACHREVIRGEIVPHELPQTVRGMRLYHNPEMPHRLNSSEPHTISPREAKAFRVRMRKHRRATRRSPAMNCAYCPGSCWKKICRPSIMVKLICAGTTTGSLPWGSLNWFGGLVVGKATSISAPPTPLVKDAKSA